MNWEKYKLELLKGEVIEFRPKGNSMQPKIESGQLVTVQPITDYSNIKKNDIVFCKVNGKFFVHLVQSVQKNKNGFSFKIGNNKNHTNGWTFQNNVFGKIIKVSD
jgi:hypothetical protein